MEINNNHKLSGDWLMYARPYREEDLVFGSPVVDASTYDAIKFVFFNGIAIKMLDGTVYASKVSVFDKHKKRFGNKYYLPKSLWTIK